MFIDKEIREVYKKGGNNYSTAARIDEYLDR